YIADQNIEDAVRIALQLNRPLLVTGDPGTGKTDLAQSVAYQLRLLPLIRFVTKSASEAKDLFYTYDALGHFRETQRSAQTGDAVNVFDHLQAQGLGAAILRGIDANAHPEIRDFLGDDLAVEKPVQSVVLIDEIDKASTDFANDILVELERKQFTVPELGGKTYRLSRDYPFSPIVVITSNSTKHLPDAFLRRCIFLHLDPPDSARMELILKSHHQSEEDPFLKAVLEVFEWIQFNSENIRKKPSTAELIDWVSALRSFIPAGHSLQDNPEAILRTLGVLVKSKDDLDQAEALVEAWKTAASSNE
ncbi:MAG: MoxR family ATPase, partial [Verrucomicrobiota bacterium]